MKPGEEGAALLSVLLLVAVMAVLSASILDRVGLATRLAGNAAGMSRAQQFAFAAEAIAAARITDIAAADPSSPTARAWPERSITLPLPGGRALARLSDGNNCFNVNSVVRRGDEGALIPDPTGVQQFAALAILLGVGADQATALAARLADWIDSDSAPAPGGGSESAAVGGALPPNRLLTDAGELRTLPGMTDAAWSRLQPFICARPEPGLSPLNVDTLTERDAPLLAMLFAGRLPLATARRVIAERPAGGYDSLVRFWDQGALGALKPAAAVRAQPVLATRWFVLHLTVSVGDAELTETALFDAEAKPARLVSRRWGDAT